jgi:hypothetical protein
MGAFMIAISIILRLVVVSIFFNTIQIQTNVPHVSSYPYIAGDTFRAFCNFIVDGVEQFDPAQVKRGDTIFLQADLREKFFKHYHPSIQQPYILVTHNCGPGADDPIPGPFKSYLEDEKIIAWFTQNADIRHPKIHPMPIGLANQCWPHGNIHTFTRCIKAYKKNSRKKLLYMNFTLNTFPSERTFVYKLFVKNKLCTPTKPKVLEKYLEDLSKYKFTLSPRGNGVDCHRTWEALLMGSFPITRTSTLNSLYENLPVVIIEDWHEVTEDFLNRKYKEMSSKKYQWEKLYAPYWFDKIKQCQAKCRE